jgi:hypothetical protein
LLFWIILIFFRLKLFFNFIPYNLVLFYFYIKLGFFLFKSIFFKSLSFLIYFFKFIPNYFGCLWILHWVFFFRLDFYVVLRSHDTNYKILKIGLGWLQSFFIIFLKFHLSSLSSLKISIFLIHLLIWFFLFYPSIQDFCLSYQFFFKWDLYSLNYCFFIL